MSLALLLLGYFLKNSASLQIWLSRQMIRMRQPIPDASLPQFTNANTIVILAMGQSNAASHGQSRSKAGPDCFAFHDGQLYVGADPWAGGSGYGGSVWSRLGRGIIDSQLSEYVIVACVAKGSTSVREWTPGAHCFSNAQRAIQSLQEKNLNVDCVIWHQGESDVIANSDVRSSYQSHLTNMIQGIRGCGVNAPVLVCLVSTFGTANAPEIRQAQLAVCQGQGNVFIGADTDDLRSDCRSDGVHFNDTGFSRFADRLFQSMTQVLSDSSAASGELKF
jgi:hypothetical protein